MYSSFGRNLYQDTVEPMAAMLSDYRSVFSCLCITRPLNIIKWNSSANTVELVYVYLFHIFRSVKCLYCMMLILTIGFGGVLYNYVQMVLLYLEFCSGPVLRRSVQ